MFLLLLLCKRILIEFIDVVVVGLPRKWDLLNK